MDFNNYLFRCSQVGNFICTGKPLSEKQTDTLRAYRDREFMIKHYQGEIDMLFRREGNNEVELAEMNYYEKLIKSKQLTDKQRLDLYSLELKLAESKEYKLSDSQKKELSKLVYYAKYGRRPDIDTRYFTKGKENEKAGRDLLGEVLGAFLTYDPERRKNEWVSGERDINHDKLIIDIKTSYHFDSYYTHLTEKAPDIYLWQLDGYMDLWGLNESLLAFVLTDTPFSLIESEIRRYDWTNGCLDFEGNVREEKIPEVIRIVNQHIYTRKGLEAFCQGSPNVMIEWFDDFVEIPKSDRVHLVYHAFDPVRIEQRNESIRVCREYMNTVKVENNLNWK